METKLLLHQLVLTSRQQRAISRRALAAKLKMSPTALQFHEEGKAAPHLGTLLRLGEELGFDLVLLAGSRSYLMRKVGPHIELAEAEKRADHYLLDKLLSEMNESYYPAVCAFIMALKQQNAAMRMGEIGAGEGPKKKRAGQSKRRKK